MGMVLAKGHYRLIDPTAKGATKHGKLVRRNTPAACWFEVWDGFRRLRLRWPLWRPWRGLWWRLWLRRLRKSGVVGGIDKQATTPAAEDMQVASLQVGADGLRAAGEDMHIACPGVGAETTTVKDATQAPMGSLTQGLETGRQL